MCLSRIDRQGYPRRKSEESDLEDAPTSAFKTFRNFWKLKYNKNRIKTDNPQNCMIVFLTRTELP